ncbi:MAG: hypothetical protein CMF23_14290 [Ignavibacteriae bacterium]|nr:hypothetical protein [Ignavibacteriota bacterium]
MKKFLLAVLVYTISLFCQSEIEVYLIDSYVTPEKPHKIILSFFTSDSTTSKVILNEKYEIEISNKLSDMHKTEIPLTNLKFDSLYVPFQIIGNDKSGNQFKSEKYQISLPEADELLVGGSQSFFTVCCFGGVIFGLPSPTIIFNNKESYFALSKEIPIMSFYSSGYNYPSGYLGIEYTYIFNSNTNNTLKLGYKHIFQTDLIEYISPGVSALTDFKGGNGFSPELSLGLFRIYNVFTFYTKYSYTVLPSNNLLNYHSVSIGLYSNFFSINF